MKKATVKKAITAKIAERQEAAGKKIFSRSAKAAVLRKAAELKLPDGDEKMNIGIIKKAGKNAAAGAMKTMGFVVTQEGNWVVKKFQSGRSVRIKKLDKINISPKIVLD